MKVFDFNIHIDYNDRAPLETLKKEQDAKASDFLDYLGGDPDIQSVDGLNLMLFNYNFFEEQDQISELKSYLDSHFSSWSFTALADYRNKNTRDNIIKLKEHSVSFIKYHCYFQELTEKEYEEALEFALLAEQHGIGILICTSYGTNKMYEVDSMKFACKISERIKNVPIVLLHSGGARVLDAMLLALDCENVYLETSFSLPFYLGSSIENDLAFAYKKIGPKRILYASDHPFMNVKYSLDTHLRFFANHGFSNSEIEDIMFNNAYHLIHSLK